MTKDSGAPAALFDIDGTLVDSNYHHVVAWHRAFLDADQQIPCWRIHPLIGRSGTELIRTLLGDDLAGRHGARIEELHSRYFLEFADVLRPFPGARELLAGLVEGGWRTVLATSAGDDELAVLRRVLDAEDVVCAVTSSADADRAKPDPDIVLTALARIGAEPGQAVLIGDAVWDVEAGLRAGVPTAAMLSGGIARQALERAGAAAIYSGALELCSHIDELDRLRSIGFGDLASARSG